MRKIIVPLLVSFCLALSACAKAPAASADQTAAQATQIAEIVNQSLTAAAPTPAAATETPVSTLKLTTTYENAVSVEIQALVGILKLEGTENAVTREQAQLLIPLWTNFKTLNQSQEPTGDPAGQGQPNAAPQAQPTVNPETQAQIEKLVEQIQAVLTPKQIQAISELKITQEIAKTTLEAQGVTEQAGPQGGPGGGNGAGGGTPPTGGGGPGGEGGGQQPGGGAMSTPPAGTAPGGAGFLSASWIEALLKVLQAK